MYATIISVAFVVCALLSVLPGILSARKRHWSEAVVRLVLTTVSAILAVVLTSAFAQKISSLIVVPLTKILSGTSVGDIISEMASAADALSIFISMIIAPTFFVLAFLTFKGFFDVFSRPITKLVLLIIDSMAKTDYLHEIYPKKKKKKTVAEPVVEAEEATDGETKANPAVAESEQKAAPKKRKFCPISAACGAACGLLAYIVVLIPIIATFSMVSTIGKSITTEGPVYEISNAMENNAATTVVSPISNPVWKNFTYYTINGEEVVIENEAHFIAVFIEALNELSSGDEATVHHSAEIFRNMSELCPNTSLIPCLCADFINAASAHWLNGEDFGGIEMPSSSTGANENDLVATLIKCLENSTSATMREDLATISNVMAILAENAVVDENGAINLTALFSNEEVIAKFSVELLNNPRLAPVMSTLVTQQAEASGAQINLPQKDGEEYTELVDDLVDKYKNIVGDTVSEESLDDLAQVIGEELAKNGVTVSESEKMALASTFISEFGDGADLTYDVMSDYIEQFRQ